MGKEIERQRRHKDWNSLLLEFGINDIAGLMGVRYHDIPVEVNIVALWKRNRKFIGEIVTDIGTPVTISSEFKNANAFAVAVMTSAQYIAFFHTHPVGSLNHRFSHTDVLSMSKKARTAHKILGLDVMGHFLITPQYVYFMPDEKMQLLQDENEYEKYCQEEELTAEACILDSTPAKQE